MRKFLLLISLSLVLASSGCSKASTSTAKNEPLVQNPPKLATEAVQKFEATESTEVIQSTESEISLEEITEPVFNEFVEVPSEKTTEPASKKTTEKIGSEDSTEPLYEKTTEPVSEEATESTTEVIYHYGICIENTSVIINDEAEVNFDTLYRDQKITIVGIEDDYYEILWYDSTGYVPSSAINLFPDDYIPDYTSGQWAGCIYKK